MCDTIPLVIQAGLSKVRQRRKSRYFVGLICHSRLLDGAVRAQDPVLPEPPSPALHFQQGPRPLVPLQDLGGLLGLRKAS